MKNGSLRYNLRYKSRVQAVPGGKRPRPLQTVNKALLESATHALANLASDIPSHKIKLVTHVLAGADLLDSANLRHAKLPRSQLLSASYWKDLSVLLAGRSIRISSKANFQPLELMLCG